MTELPMLINALHTTEPNRGSDRDRRGIAGPVALFFIRTIALSIVSYAPLGAKPTESFTRRAFAAAGSTDLNRSDSKSPAGFIVPA
ncbi:MAG: hypothetical protein ACI8Z1_003904, partial [Candidatus Azotimanducaceae bacterium]